MNSATASAPHGDLGILYRLHTREGAKADESMPQRARIADPTDVPCTTAFSRVETRDLTAPSQDGWAVDYRIRREDGEELHAEVRCWEKAHAAAERAANTDALATIADRGSAAALEYAEFVESPATCGAVMISMWFDPVDEGNLRRRVSYERAPA